MTTKRSFQYAISAAGWRGEADGKLDWLTVRCVPIGFRPGFFACGERGRIGQTFCRNQAFESGKPMIVVSRTVVGLTAIGSGFELRGQRGGPFLPGEVA